MLLSCSDSSGFFLHSHFRRGKASRLSCKAFPGQTLLSEGSWGHQRLSFAGLWQVHHSCQGAPQAVCVHGKNHQHCPWFKQCPQWLRPFLGSSLANEQHILISSPWLPWRGVCSGCGSHVICNDRLQLSYPGLLTCASTVFWLCSSLGSMRANISQYISIL